MGWFTKHNNSGTLIAILNAAKRIEKQGDKIMGIVEDIQAKLQSMGTSIDGIETDQAALVTKIQELSDIIAGGGVITTSQLEPVLELATAIDERLKGIDVALP